MSAEPVSHETVERASHAAPEPANPMIQALLAELEQEARTTRRLFERIPEEKLAWKPHEKSRTLGALALHVAASPARVAAAACEDCHEMRPADVQPASRQEILDALDSGVVAARELLGGMADARLAGTWQATLGGRPVMEMPRGVFLRSILLNHHYHHRGQVSVYLRLLGVPLPMIYGPTADENPFA